MTHRPLKSMVSSTAILGTSFNATSIILMFQFHFIFSNTKERKCLKCSTQAFSEDGTKCASWLVWLSVSEPGFQERTCLYE